MSSTRATGSSAADAVAANERIRALVDAADGTWPSEAYEVLLQEWAAAVHRGDSDQVDEAA